MSVEHEWPAAGDSWHFNTDRPLPTQIQDGATYDVELNPETLWCHEIFVSSFEYCYPVHNSGTELTAWEIWEENMYNFSVTIVLADGLAPAGAKSSVRTAMT